MSTTPGSTFGRTHWGLPFALPRIGDDLVFGRPHNTVNHNDLTNLTSIRNLTFSDTAGPFTLTGGALGITGIVSNLGDSLQTLDLPLTALQSGTWSGGTGGIDITGLLSVGDLSLVLKDRVSVRNAGKSLIVGAQQSGSLSLRSGSSLVAGTATLGVAEGSAGTLSLNGSDVSAETEFLGLGQGGDGVLFLGSGATMTASNVVYGASSTGTGSIHVTGSGSRLSVGDDISPG